MEEPKQDAVDEDYVDEDEMEAENDKSDPQTIMSILHSLSKVDLIKQGKDMLRENNMINMRYNVKK